MDVFINDITAFMPNEPVNNAEIEDVVGRVNDCNSKAKRLVLKNNKIQTRYYAIDRETGRMTHSNARLTAEAVRRLRPYEAFSPDDIQCLCCGTATPDLLFPGHALMVLGELGIAGCEAVTASGICISSMNALKYAWMNVAAGISQNAVAAGSELSSSYMRAGYLTPQINENPDLENKPIRAFDADFLRWMLSDGAGAAYLSPVSSSDRISLRIDWIDSLSFAGEMETCMYGGGVKQADGSVKSWREIESIPEKEKPFLFTVRQDIKILDAGIVDTMGRTLKRMAEKYNLSPEKTDWFLPHYSSDYFRPKFYEEMKRIGFEIPYDRWFTNLTSKGNTGSASIYIILEELFASGRLSKGDRLLCFIPESGRFSHCFMQLTAV